MITITTSHNHCHTVGITDGTVSSLCATDYKDPPTVTVFGGGGDIPAMSYQEVTGTLNPGAHPGSYNGQDAWSNLLVTDNVDLLERNRYLQHTDIKKRRGGATYA